MEDAPTYSNALPLKSMLLEYRLESVLGAGGFGITYLGWDTHLEKNVAIKEYLPGQLAMRALDGSVVPVNTDRKYDFKWGLDRFIQEARTLAKFSHPNIVGVNRFFEANGTSYMVMPYEAGESLHQYLRRVAMPPEGALKNILLPILDGLGAVHQAGFLHRDIKPSNVFIRENGTPVLLDFGAARMARGDGSQSLTAIVSYGYTPLEQYVSDGNQGPWSDIYALACVMYRAVTNENPPDAVRRMKADDAPQSLTAARARYSERFLKAIELAMSVDEKLRPQSVAEWRELLSGQSSVVAPSRPLPAANAPRGAVASEAAAPGAKRASGAASNRRTNAFGRPLPPDGQSGGFGKWIFAGVLLAIALGYSLANRRPTLPAQPAAVPLQTQVTHTESKPAAPTEPQSVAAAEQQSVASAEPLPPRSQGNLPASVKLEFAGADTDGNGYLTPSEIKGRFPFIERNFTLVDADHDGRVSVEEFWQLRRKQKAVGPR